MPIEKITADDLRDMEHQEGLVLQGCGGEAQEWLDGINDLLTQDGILQNGSRFETVKVFQHDGLNNLLFPFENIQVDMGKLAMWRLQTHGAFGGTWLSDYVPNRLGGFRSARQENPGRRPAKLSSVTRTSNSFTPLLKNPCWLATSATRSTEPLNNLPARASTVISTG